MNKSDLTGGLLLFFFGLATTILSWQLPIGSMRMPGSGLFPLILGALLMLVSLLYSLGVFLQKTTPASLPESPRIPGAARRVLCFLGSIALALVLLNPIGYLLTVFFLMAILLRLLGMKRPLLLFIFSAASAGFSHLLFVYWLKVPLPLGLLGF